MKHFEMMNQGGWNERKRDFDESGMADDGGTLDKKPDVFVGDHGSHEAFSRLEKQQLKYKSVLYFRK